MPDAMQRQTNTSPHVAQIPEYLSPGGEVLAARDVEPGGEIDYPLRLTGFSGWVDPAEDESAAAAGEEPAIEAKPTEAPAVKQAAKKAASVTAATSEKE